MAPRIEPMRRKVPGDELQASRGIIALALWNTCAHQQNTNRNRIVAQSLIAVAWRSKLRACQARPSLVLSHRQIGGIRTFPPQEHGNSSLIVIKVDSIRIKYYLSV